MKNRTLFLIILGSGNSKIKALADLVYGESCSLLLRWHHVAAPPEAQGKEEEVVSLAHQALF